MIEVNSVVKPAHNIEKQRKRIVLCIQFHTVLILWSRVIIHFWRDEQIEIKIAGSWGINDC